MRTNELIMCEKIKIFYHVFCIVIVLDLLIALLTALFSCPPTDQERSYKQSKKSRRFKTRKHNHSVFDAGLIQSRSKWQFLEERSAISI